VGRNGHQYREERTNTGVKTEPIGVVETEREPVALKREKLVDREKGKR
jgi:hypothetical protein